MTSGEPGGVSPRVRGQGSGVRDRGSGVGGQGSEIANIFLRREGYHADRTISAWKPPSDGSPGRWSRDSASERPSRPASAD